MTDYSQAMWELYWYHFHTNHTRDDRKHYLRRMMHYGMTARQAIEEMRSSEREEMKLKDYILEKIEVTGLDF